MKSLQNWLGATMLFIGYLGTAWLITKVSGYTFDRALSIITLVAVSQVRWFSKDESPIG